MEAIVNYSKRQHGIQQHKLSDSGGQQSPATANQSKNQRTSIIVHSKAQPSLSLHQTGWSTNRMIKSTLLVGICALLSHLHYNLLLAANGQQMQSQIYRVQLPAEYNQLLTRGARYATTGPLGEPLQFQPEPAAAPLQITSSARQIVMVPGSNPAFTMNHHQQQLEPLIVLPNDNFLINSSQDLKISNVIDHKRFIETVSMRCLASTILEDPTAVEPSFIIIKPGSEIRLNATAPVEKILKAGFEPQKRTTILVHGFTQSYPETTWLRRTRALYEMHSLVHRQNLIIMDWGKASQGSYSQVAAMVSGMGSFLSNFIMKLIEMGTDRMAIHVIGHSLGAHLAGFAGKRIRPRIGRITALDPAGPCFGKILSNSPTDRLSPDDAYEVDVYHYDDDFLGLPGQHGQFDVYVNGGSSQPGCTDNMNTMFQALITMVFRRNRILSESHTRSTEVSTAQLSTTGCQQVAYECRDYAAFMLGECGKCDSLNTQCFLMGFSFQYSDIDEIPLRTSFPGKRLYISTGSNEIFCMNHYQVLVKFEPTPEMAQAAKRNKWSLQLFFLSEQQERLNTTTTNQMAPNVFSSLLLTDTRPARIKAAQLQVRASDGSVVYLQQQSNSSRTGNKLSFRVFSIEVNFMSNINPQVRRSLSSRLCPSGQEVNSIRDSSATGSNSDGWLQFDECLVPAPSS